MNQKSKTAASEFQMAYEKKYRKDPPWNEIFILWHTSAQKGYIRHFYGKGEFVKKDYKKMLYWYKLSAKAGIADAQRDLGYAHFYGHGIKQDKVKVVGYLCPDHASFRGSSYPKQKKQHKCDEYNIRRTE
jgi:TPR repeat protein